MALRDGTISRRDVLRAMAATAAVVPAVQTDALGAFVLPADGPRFFTRSQYALVDELTEILIPQDEHSGGARAAGVAAFIDGRLAETFEPADKERWVAGLLLVEAAAQQRGGTPFLQLSPADREAVVADMARDEVKPATPAGKFFVVLKRLTIKGYYTSKIGIHDEMEYKGNTMQQEYSGIDVRDLKS